MSSVAVEELCQILANNPDDVIRGYLSLDLETTNL